MLKKAVFPGKYVQGEGAIGELPALIELLGKKGLILASPSANSKVLPGCGVDWSARGIPIGVFRGEWCEDGLGRLSPAIAQGEVNYLRGTVNRAPFSLSRRRICYYSCIFQSVSV